MKRIALSASALALLSGIAMAAPAQAASLTAHERAVLARDHAHVRALGASRTAPTATSACGRGRAIRLAEARLHGLAWRLRHN